MCKCTPELRTPFCGKPGCEAPPQRTRTEPPETCGYFTGKRVPPGCRLLLARITDLQRHLAEADAWIAAQGQCAPFKLSGPAEAVRTYRDALARHSRRTATPNTDPRAAYRDQQVYIPGSIIRDTLKDIEDGK